MLSPLLALAATDLPAEPKPDDPPGPPDLPDAAKKLVAIAKESLPSYFDSEPGSFVSSHGYAIDEEGGVTVLALYNGVCACFCALLLVLVSVDATRKIRRLRRKLLNVRKARSIELARQRHALERAVVALYLYGANAGRPDKHHVYACREVVEVLYHSSIDLDDDKAVRELCEKLTTSAEML